MRTVFLHLHLDECHQLTVVLQVGITLPFHVALQDLTGHLRTTLQLHIVFQTLCQVKVTTDHPYQFVLQSFHLFLQETVLFLKLLDLFLCHFSTLNSCRNPLRLNTSSTSSVIPFSVEV